MIFDHVKTQVPDYLTRLNFDCYLRAVKVSINDTHSNSD
jgi:hypothetical protein